MRLYSGFLALTLALAVIFLSARPACADSAFTVAGVHVDASAASVIEARNWAIAGGRPVAWQMLFRRLTRQQDWARQPMLDDAQLQRLITTYYPTNERRSTRRYVADVTYIFNPEAVARLLQGAGVPYTASQSRRILVIPMAPTYSRGSLWTAALASTRFAGSVVPFTVPPGDAQDERVLGRLAFDTATWAEVEPAASRSHSNVAVLIQAAVVGNKLVVTLRRLGAGELPTKTSVEVPLLQGASTTYPAAADAAVEALEDLWKSRAALDFSQKSTLIVDVRTNSLAQFAGLQSALASVPNVASVTIIAMNIGEARLSLTYLGTADQLREALAQAGMVLVNRGGEWQLSQANAGAP